MRIRFTGGPGTIYCYVPPTLSSFYITASNDGKKSKFLFWTRGIMIKLSGRGSMYGKDVIP